MKIICLYITYENRTNSNKWAEKWMNVQVEEIPKSEAQLKPIKYLRWSFCAKIVNGLLLLTFSAKSSILVLAMPFQMFNPFWTNAPFFEHVVEE